MEISEGFAELYGAMLGDGCLSEWVREDRGSRCCVMVMTGHTHDRPYYAEVLNVTMQELFGTQLSIRRRENMNCIDGRTYRRHVVNAFLQFGFPLGLKRDLVIPWEFMQDDTLYLACIRGIFDTDGSVYRRYSRRYKGHARKYDHNVIQIKMNQQALLQQVLHLLELQGMRCNRLTEDGGHSVLRITHQESIARFWEVVKPSNSWHNLRYENGPEGI